MSTVSVLAIGATVFGIVMSLAPVTQILLILRTRQSADVSITFIGLILAGVSVWLAYGISLGNEVLIISETIGVITNSTAILVILWFRRESGDQASVAKASVPMEVGS
jgi:MtN3 and saliva related transmembrane protein